MTLENVVILGAGPAGLSVAGALRARGIDALVVDRADHVGASWRRHYDRLHLHTTRRGSHLPGYPIPRAFGRWVARDDVVRYLEQYAAHHQVRTRLGCAVAAIERPGPEAQPGAPSGARWVVRLADGEAIAARHVVVATGYNHTPVDPDWPGLDAFAGEVVRAADYRNGTPYAGRRVLVVGTGNTGMEIATDLADHGAAPVWLAVRTPPHILARSQLGWSAQATGVLVRHLPPRVVDRLAGVLAAVQEPNLTEFGIPRAGADLYSRALAGRIPVQDVGIVRAIRERRVTPVAAVVGMSETEVELADGTTLSPDAVIVATGYRAGLEPLLGHLDVLGERGLPRVQGAHQAPGAEGLWFTGYTNPISGMLRELRLDGVRIAQAISDAATDPVSPALTTGAG